MRILFTLSLSIFFSLQSFAVEVTAPTRLLPTIDVDPGVTIAKIIAYFVMLTGVSTVIALTWAGIQMILAS